MKVELQCGDTIAIPYGCKAIVKDGCVVFEKEQEFKDGDILAFAKCFGYPCPFIYKNTDVRRFHQFYVGVNSLKEICLSDGVDKRWGNRTLRYATEEEKQELFDKLKKKGLRWNAEKKEVEKVRWRAERGKKFFYLYAELKPSEVIDIKSEADSFFWENCSYFSTKEQAKEAVKRVKETLRKFHEEIGE